MHFLQMASVSSLTTRRATRVRALLAAFVLLLPAITAAATPTLERLRETGVLRLGYLTAVPPYSYHDESGEPAGYAVALCERIAQGLLTAMALPALSTGFVAVDPDARFDAVQSGQVDLLCAGGTPTLALREKVSFTIPIFPGGIGALIRQDAPARLQAALAGEPQAPNPRWGTSLGQVLQKRILVAIPGSRAAEWLEGRVREFGLESTIGSIDSIDQGLGLVAERQADAMFAEREILLYAVRHDTAASNLAVLDRKFTFEAVAFALPRGDDDFRLLVDAELSRLYRSGEWTEIYVPVFGEPDDVTRRFFQDTAIAE